MTIDRRKFIQMSAAAAAAPVLPACDRAEVVPASGVPRSRFNAESTAEEVTAGLDLKGKIAVVTGCNSGIGYETMRVLALRGAYVIGTGRTMAKAQAACASVKGVTTPVQLELADFDSIVACAQAISSLNAPIDMLICNAGMRGGHREVVNGVEKNFAVNHLGHFLLVNRLIERLYLARQGRVVVVASRAAYRGAPDDGIQFDDLRAEHNYSDSRAYGHSKLANVLFSLELAKLLRGTRITSNALHPGVINTNIVRNVSSILRSGFALLTRVSGKTIAQGAATSCFVATNEALGNTSGAYFEDCNAVTIVGDNHMQDTEQADRLWLRSEELVSDYMVKPERPDPTEFRNGYRGRTAAEQDQSR